MGAAVATVKPAVPPIRAPPMVAAVMAHIEAVPVTTNLATANPPMARMGADSHNNNQSICVDFGGVWGNSPRGSLLLLPSKMTHHKAAENHLVGGPIWLRQIVTTTSKEAVV